MRMIAVAAALGALAIGTAPVAAKSVKGPRPWTYEDCQALCQKRWVTPRETAYCVGYVPCSKFPHRK
jgi:hypothetical protein